jgi:small subunit ribosomal protein S29
VRPSTTPLVVPRHASLLVTPFAPFSTTAANEAKEVKAHVRAGKKLVLGKFKKNKVETKGKAPGPGERKAYRKRITLSNDNALQVPWLTDMAPESLLDSANVAKILALPEELQDQLRASEAFKTTQSWKMFRKPSVLVRSETVDLMNRIQDAVGKKQTLRVAITGDKVAGKSMMLLQALSHAYLNNWIVIHLPEGLITPISCHETWN